MWKTKIWVKAKWSDRERYIERYSEGNIEWKTDEILYSLVCACVLLKLVSDQKKRPTTYGLTCNFCWGIMPINFYYSMLMCHNCVTLKVNTIWCIFIWKQACYFFPSTVCLSFFIFCCCCFLHAICCSLRKPILPFSLMYIFSFCRVSVLTVAPLLYTEGSEKNDALDLCICVYLNARSLVLTSTNVRSITMFRL